VNLNGQSLAIGVVVVSRYLSLYPEIWSFTVWRRNSLYGVFNLVRVLVENGDCGLFTDWVLT